MTAGQTVISASDDGLGVAVHFDGLPFILEIGADLQMEAARRSAFEGSLMVDWIGDGASDDRLGRHEFISITFRDGSGPLLRQTIRAYRSGLAESAVIVETTALREMTGTSVADSYFHTTFNSPVFRLAKGLSYLTFTWGLTGGEGTGVGGNFPDAAIAPSLEDLPEQLKMADFSPDTDLHQSGNKPFAPLIAFDADGRTMVAAPLDYLLISPMRLTETPKGLAVARGLHGAVNQIPAGTTTNTAFVFGMGLVDTMLRWGRLMAKAQGCDVPKTARGPEIGSLGFWNCYGGYYAQLFRPTTAQTLRDLASYFKEADIPVRYLGLDLWYPHSTVGFSTSYRPDPEKYPDGLGPLAREIGLPLLLHMSAFDRNNEYSETHNLTREEGAAYPREPLIHQDLARDFRDWGASGIWHDFLRTQLQNCHSLRAKIGEADRVFDGMVRAMAAEELDVMLCMPTIGHYLASAAYENVVAVRTSTDYVNHKPRQAEMLSHLSEYRSIFPAGRNFRQNLFLSFLAGVLGLAPSHDVFISNQDHPEGFEESDAEQEALARALSAGIVGFGDKVGHADKSVIDKLAFPDGRLAQPDHPPYPLASTILSSVPAFYSTTTIGGFTWTYVIVWNLTDEPLDYSVDLGPLMKDGDLMYDFFDEAVLSGQVLSGRAEAGSARYAVLVPLVGGGHPLGFAGKYVPVSRAQVRSIEAEERTIAVHCNLRQGSHFSFASVGAEPTEATGSGLEIQAITKKGEITFVDLTVTERECTLELSFIGE
ncbi:MAG: hypothetical protein O3A93_06045 [Chloroflexi bacterium]|nr:hypothetical protein [Chloroflexota bacterium]MDA1270803.1 hypothetical protein [Chloroflexota bacterium]